MNSDKLAHFAAVADAGSISAAAIEVGCNASTLSRRISQLESEFGVRLFHRSGRGVSLTPQGKLLREQARQVQALLDQVASVLATRVERDPPVIRIAAQPTIAKALFSELFHALRAEFPGSRVHFSEGLASSILSGLQSGDIDVAVMYRPVHTGHLAYETLLSEPLYLLVPPNHPPLPDPVPAENLTKLPLILPSSHHGLRLAVENAINRYGIQPNVVLECNSSIAITLDLVHKGCGCTLLPLAAATEALALDRIRAYLIAVPELCRDVALVSGKTQMPSQALWKLDRLMRSLLKRLITHGSWPGATWCGAAVP